MGLDATVMCNCYKGGVISTPPFAEHIFLDDEGYLNLDLPFNENPQLHNQFYQWIRTACTHEDMNFANEHISNWTGYRSFKQAVGNIGWHNFPVLHQQLPRFNGGVTSSESAGHILEELTLFSRQKSLGKSHFLINADDNKILYEYIVTCSGRFIFSGVDHLEFGIDDKEFFIERKRENKNAHRVFGSTNFEQVFLEPELTDNNESGRVKYFDKNTELAFVCNTAVSGGAIPWPNGNMQNDEGKFRFTYPKNMYTEWRERKPSDYQYLVEPLMRICKAAIEMGNPIRWC